MEMYHIFKKKEQSLQDVSVRWIKISIGLKLINNIIIN